MQMGIEFLRQYFCGHQWEKLPNFRQTKKDQNKILWVCSKCNRLKESFRWDPPTR
jgi:hypothetical protein